MRMIPWILAAVVVITIYAWWLRRRFAPAPAFDDTAALRARANLVAGEVIEALEGAETDLAYRTAQLGEAATHEFARALTAATRDRDDVLRLLDLIGHGRDDLDAMLVGATDRAAASVTQLRRARHEVDTRARDIASVPARIAAADRLVTDLRRALAIESDRSMRLRGTHPPTGRPPTPRRDLDYAAHLLDRAAEAAADARRREDGADTRGALGQIQAAEALADEAGGIIDPGGIAPLPPSEDS